MSKSRQTGNIISGLDAIPEGNLVSVDADGNPVDGGTQVVITGATGSFTAQSGETITVTNGLITDITTP